MTGYFDPNRTAVYVQPGGFAQQYFRLPPETDVTGPSGGGASFESDFQGDGVYVGRRITSNPEPWTFTLSVRKDVYRKLIDMSDATLQCFFNLIVLQGCAPNDINTYTSGDLFIDAGFASFGTSSDVAKGTERNDEKVMDTYDLDAGLRRKIYKPAHTKIVDTISTVAYNDIIPTGYVNCAGTCGAENDGHSEFIAVGDPVAPATIPRIFYTRDRWRTNVTSTLGGVTDGIATSVTVQGSRVIVAVTGTSGGIYTASLAALKAGSLTVQLANGIASGTNVNKVFTVGTLVFAVGDTGDLWVSDDGGYSFAEVPSGVAVDLVALGSTAESLVWAGGATTTLLRIRAGYLAETITIAGATGDITSIDVPFKRSNEVYVSTDTGEVWRSFNANDDVPVFTELEFDKPVSSSIKQIKFAGPLGACLWMVQNNGSSQSRVLRDISGGRLADMAEAIGVFTSPANSLINAIAPTGINSAMTAGEANGGVGFLGQIRG